MERLLPIGSIVILNNGKQKLMITGRGSLYNNGGTIGYFEYSACIYPFGVANQQALFFNHENIKEIIFEGYSDADEEEYCRLYDEQIQQCNYPRLGLQQQASDERR